VLALLDERRSNVTTQRTRLVNQLHAVFRDLVPGGAPTHLTAAIASRLLAGIRPAGSVEAARKQLARDLVVEIRQADQRLPETTPGRPHLATHDPRRTTRRSGPGRTPGGDSAIQRGWLNP
jgi:hypothetical protein